MRRIRRFLARSLGCALVLLAVGTVTAPSASAHASLLESTPKPGARLEASPAEIKLEFTEPLNRALSKATLTNLRTGRAVRLRRRAVSGKQLVFVPTTRLPKAAYRVDWHTVSTLDGHALEGSIGFGVGTAAQSGAAQLEQSPLARNGWLRIAARVLFYVPLFFFAGGLLNELLLGRGRPPGGWLVPPELADGRSPGGKLPSPIAVAAWRRTAAAGWLALAGAAAVALADTADASGGLSARGASDFLLSNTPGLARVGTVAAVGLAVALLSRTRLLAAGTCALALLLIALSGHANSADPRALAVGSDWLHLLAASVWVGGIAQIVLTWAPRIGGVGADLRRAVIRGVLARFGRVALPAFLMVAAAGAANAVIQLGHLSAFWTTDYGAALAVKIALVGSVALASYLHALRLRPRVLAGAAEPVERRHWRLLRSEPVLGAGALAVAALLVAFPLPPRQLQESAAGNETESFAACNPCPLVAPARDELSVADGAGSTLVAAWIRRHDAGLQGRIRLYGLNLKPVRARPQVAGARISPCGRGCWGFETEARPDQLAVRLPQGGRTYAALLPARWDPGGNARARRLLDETQAAMRRLSTVRESETITSGPGTFAGTRYELQAPNRFAYLTNRGVRTVVVGQREWFRERPGGVWHRQLYGGGPPPFRTRSWFTWTTYARAARLLRIDPGREMAELALMDPGTPVWFRLSVDLSTKRVQKVRMIATGHFMSQRYYAFNGPLQIEAPDGR